MSCPYKIGDIVCVAPPNEDTYNILVLTELHKHIYEHPDVWVSDCMILETGEIEYDFPIIASTDKVIV